MNIRGFLRWQFEGTSTNPSFWGIVLALLGFLAAVFDCPQPWPMALVVLGAALALFDGLRSYFRFSYRIYEMEQQKIISELERKERGNS